MLTKKYGNVVQKGGTMLVPATFRYHRSNLFTPAATGSYDESHINNVDPAVCC